MRTTFLGYYRFTEEEFSILWEDCLFVLDANVILNLYRYSADTSEALLTILEGIFERLWLPHQVALEYQDNRLETIAGQEKLFEEVSEILENTLKKLRDSLRVEHLSINVDDFLEMIEINFESIEAELAKHRKQHPDLFKNDHIRNAITTLFEGKVGAPYSPEELKKIYQDGEERYSNQVPPGYKDRKEKKGKVKRFGNLVIQSEYGDLILWHQIIDKAKNDKKPIIFVSDDKKDDWWWESKGKTVGPRPELITEMQNEAGVKFYMYTTDRFVGYAGEYLKIQVDEGVVNEVQEVAEERRSWKEEIVEALKVSGGKAHLSDIYDQIDSTTLRELPKTWKATVRYTLQIHSSDTESYKRGEDLFCRLDRGYWGLRNYIENVQTEVQD